MDRAVLRHINREVAAKYLPELAQLIDAMVAQGFSPRVTRLVFAGEALDYFNLLVSRAEQAVPQQHPEFAE